MGPIKRGPPPSDKLKPGRKNLQMAREPTIEKTLLRSGDNPLHSSHHPNIANPLQIRCESASDWLTKSFARFMYVAVLGRFGRKRASMFAAFCVLTAA
jgi:hypothetical protein